MAVGVVLLHTIQVPFIALSPELYVVYVSYEMIVLTYASVLVKDSCILGNNEGKRVYYADSTGTITVSNCTMTSFLAQDMLEMLHSLKLSK
jgi:hypothetical protein